MQKCEYLGTVLTSVPRKIGFGSMVLTAEDQSAHEVLVLGRAMPIAAERASPKMHYTQNSTYRGTSAQKWSDDEVQQT